MLWNPQELCSTGRRVQLIRRGRDWFRINISPNILSTTVFQKPSSLTAEVVFYMRKPPGAPLHSLHRCPRRTSLPTFSLVPIKHQAPLRAYSQRPPRPLRYLPSAALSLDHFLLRNQTISLYRAIIRSCYRLPDSHAREEMKIHARAEFERQKDVGDIRKIRYLLSTGRAEWKKLAGMFGGNLPF